MPTTLFILAGEASGDLHGAKLIEAWKELDPSARFVGMGGPKMAAAGLEVAKDLDGMQVVGFWEVAKRYGFFKRVFYQLLDRVKQERPAALICIDYPGFNLRFAKAVKKLGIPCLYYIVPQVWAWKPKRAAKMAAFIDRAYCVFEFEPPFFEKFRTPARAMKTEFVGHPLLDCGLRIADCGLTSRNNFKTIAFLPGSREKEILFHLSPLHDAYRIVKGNYDTARCLISISDSTPKMLHKYYRSVVSEDESAYDPVGMGGNPHEDDYGPNGTPDILIGGKAHAAADNQRLLELGKHSPHASLLPALSDFSVVKSGTSTLEAGLQGNPMCVVYKGGRISYAIARLLVDIPVFSLVNIVLGRYAVPELLQDEVNPQRIAAEIERGLTDRKYIDQQRAALAELPKKLGGPGASKRAAQGMLDFLKGKANS
ncbi:MAG: hypothetical protein M5U26_26050 [Planctomycetota bacterium]|nr:hypothetical protein [Planctomycetota bacterium]